MRFLKGKDLARAAVAAAAIAGMATIGTTSVSAQAACQDGSNVMVEFLGVGASNTVLYEQAEGYAGQVRVRVFCGADGSLVPNARVTLSTAVPNSFVTPPGGTEQTAPVTIDLPTGEALVGIRSSDPGLTGWKARVGTYNVTVTGAYDTGLGANEYPTADAAIWAQTPELGSLALFGSGAAGMAGYGLMRLRAMRRPKQ